MAYASDPNLDPNKKKPGEEETLLAGAGQISGAGQSTTGQGQAPDQ